MDLAAHTTLRKGDGLLRKVNLACSHARQSHGPDYVDDVFIWDFDFPGSMPSVYANAIRKLSDTPDAFVRIYLGEGASLTEDCIARLIKDRSGTEAGIQFYLFEGFAQFMSCITHALTHLEKGRVDLIVPGREVCARLYNSERETHCPPCASELDLLAEAISNAPIMNPIDLCVSMGILFPVWPRPTQIAHAVRRLSNLRRDISTGNIVPQNLYGIEINSATDKVDVHLFRDNVRMMWRHDPYRLVDTTVRVVDMVARHWGDFELQMEGTGDAIRPVMAKLAGIQPITNRVKITLVNSQHTPEQTLASRLSWGMLDPMRSIRNETLSFKAMSRKQMEMRRVRTGMQDTHNILSLLKVILNPAISGESRTETMHSLFMTSPMPLLIPRIYKNLDDKRLAELESFEQVKELALGVYNADISPFMKQEFTSHQKAMDYLEGECVHLFKNLDIRVDQFKISPELDKDEEEPRAPVPAAAAPSM